MPKSPFKCIVLISVKESLKRKYMKIIHNGVEISVSDRGREQQILAILMGGEKKEKKVYQKRTRTWHPYSDVDDTTLVAMYKSGSRIRTIAHRMGRTPVAVSTRLYSLIKAGKLEKRGLPVAQEAVINN